MARRLNPLEKEFLIQRFKGNPTVKMADFCEANSISITAFKKWLDTYNSEGIAGLAKGKDLPPILPEGVDETAENYKREILKLRIELERAKKNYTVEMSETGEKIFKPLKEKNSQS